MTSKDIQKPKPSDENADNPKLHHKHHRHHVTSNKIDMEPMTEDEIPTKDEQPQDAKINDQSTIEISNNPIQSVSALIHKENHYRLSRKKEIFVITSGDTFLKFKTLSQGHLHKQKQLDKKQSLSNENIPEAISSNNGESNSNEHLIDGSSTSSDLLKQGKSSLTNQEELPQEKSKEEDAVESESENIKTKMLTVSTHISDNFFSTIKRKPTESSSKVISTKVKQKWKPIESSSGDIPRMVDDRSHKKLKKEERNKSVKNSDSTICNLADIYNNNEDDVKALNNQNKCAKSGFRKQRTQNQDNDFAANKRRHSNHQSKSYSKHVLDRNIRQWKNVDPELSNSSSDHSSDILDLAEVLNDKKKNKLGGKDGSVRYSEITSESIVPAEVRKVPKPQNDLILMNAIVTGINNLGCYNEIVHVNKIPKVVRLDEILRETDNIVSNKIISKINLKQESEIEENDLPGNNFNDAVSKVLMDTIPFNEDSAKEVSNSELNSQPTANPIPLPSAQNKELLKEPVKVNDIVKKKTYIADKELLNKLVKKPPQLQQEKTSEDILEPTVVSTNNDPKFKIDGIEPPKKVKKNLPISYMARKNIITGIEKLEVVILPVLEVTPYWLGLNTFKETTSTIQQHQTRRKENHRLPKRISPSSSESTVQLTNLLESHTKLPPDPEKPVCGD